MICFTSDHSQKWKTFILCTWAQINTNESALIKSCVQEHKIMLGIHVEEHIIM